MGASTSQGSVQGNYSSVNGTTKREAKSADSKTSDSQGRGNTSIQTPPSKPDAPDKTVPVVAAQVMPSPALAGNAGIKDFTPNEFVTGTALNDQVTSSSVSGADSTPQTVPIVAVQPMPSPALPGNAGIKDFTPNKLVTLGAALNDQIASSSASGADSTPQTVPVVVLQPMSSPTFPGNTGMNDDGTSSPISGVDSTTEPDAIAGSRSLPASFKGAPAEHQSASPQESASMVTPGTGEAAAVASLITGLSGALASDSKTQPGSVPLPLRNVSHGPRETIDDDNQAQTAAKSATDPFVVPLTGVPPALVSPISTTENVEPGNSQGTPVKPALDQSGVNGTQEAMGTTRKNIEVTGSAKAQSRKDDSAFSANSQAADQGAGSAPAKAIEAFPSFSVAAIQPPPITGDGKSAIANLSPGASEQQTSHLDQESTGVVQSQTQTENAAAYPTSLVNSAKLVERMGESELRLGIRAGEYGSVDIRTSMVRNQFTAEISVERGELGRVMAAELPSLQNRLAEQRVPVANITVQNHTGSQSTASEQQKSQDGQQRYATNSVNEREEGPIPALVALEGTASASRLDIHM